MYQADSLDTKQIAQSRRVDPALNLHSKDKVQSASLEYLTGT